MIASQVAVNEAAWNILTTLKMSFLLSGNVVRVAELLPRKSSNTLAVKVLVFTRPNTLLLTALRTTGKIILAVLLLKVPEIPTVTFWPT